jgi:predicted nucleotidyltransferase
MKRDKTELLARIKNVINKIDPEARLILYGSRARGDEHVDSDWDLLILVNSKTDLDYEKVFRHSLYDLELKSGEAFSVSVYNKNEWDSNYWMTPLYQNVAREGIRI